LLDLSLLISDLKRVLKVDRPIKVKVKSFKTKVASISHKSGTIYINKLCLEHLTEKEIKFILAHEILHLKHGKFHTKTFKKELIELFGEDLHAEIENKLMEVIGNYGDKPPMVGKGSKREG